MPYCIAQFCKNGDKCNPRKVHFHRLPNKAKKLARWRSWVVKCNRREENIQDAQARVCSDHFRREDYANHLQYEAGLAKNLLLKHDAVPTIFADPETPASVRPKEKSPSACVKRRRQRGESRHRAKVGTQSVLFMLCFCTASVHVLCMVNPMYYKLSY